MADESAISLAAKALERVGALDQKADSAHARIDELRSDMKEERKLLREDLSQIYDGIKKLDAHVNRGQGAMAVISVGSGVIGAVIVFVVNLILK